MWFQKWVGKGGRQTISSVILRKLVTWTACVYLGSREALMSLDEDGKYAWMCSIRYNSMLINLFSTELSGMGLEPGFQAFGASARWSQQRHGQILPAGTCQGSCIECEAQGSQGAFARAGWSLLLEFSLSIQIALAFSMHISSGAAEWVWAPGVGLPMWVYSCTHSLLTGQSVLLGWELTCSQGDLLSLRACGYVSNSGTARGIYHPFIK